MGMVCLKQECELRRDAKLYFKSGIFILFSKRSIFIEFFEQCRILFIREFINEVLIILLICLNVLAKHSTSWGEASFRRNAFTRPRRPSFWLPHGGCGETVAKDRQKISLSSGSVTIQSITVTTTVVYSRVVQPFVVGYFHKTLGTTKKK